MHYHADIVFIGDSITEASNFDIHFPSKKIVNMGVSSETIQGIYKRAETIKYLSPNYIFIMAGINSLSSYNIDTSLRIYDKTIKLLIKENPNAKIYVQSVLPIAKFKEDILKNNNDIIKYNQGLKSICYNNNVEYIDVHSIYFKDGYMNPNLAIDGVHPTKESYKLWAAKISKYIL